MTPDQRTGTVDAAAAFERAYGPAWVEPSDYVREEPDPAPAWLDICRTVQRQHPGWEWHAVAVETSQRYAAAYAEWRSRQ